MITLHRHSALPDEQLMLMIAKGNEAAFTELYQRYAGKLVVLMKRQLGSETQAHDLLHDVFLQLIERPGQFDTKQRFSPWIYSVALNRCRNELRNNGNRQRLLNEQIAGPTASAGPAIEQQLQREEFKQAYEQLYQQLEEDQQLLLTLRFNQELPVKEIAQIMELKEGTVKSRLFYLMKYFAEQLKIHHPIK